MFKLSKYILQYWYFYVFAIICMVLQVGLDMLSPQITKRIIDDVIGNGQIELLVKLLLTVFIIGLGRCVFGYLKEFTFDFVSSKIANKIRFHLFHHIQGLSVSFFDKNNTGELMSRVKDDVDKIWNALGFVGMLILEVCIHSGIVLYCMFHLSTKLFIIPIISMPVVALVAILMERKLDKVYEEISEENAKLNTIAQENLAGVRTVKAFAREKHEIQKFLSHNKKYYELNMQQSRELVRFYPLFQFVSKLLPIVSIVYGGILVINKEITLGTLGAFVQYCNYIVWPMEILGWLINDFSSALASRKKLKKIYEETSSIQEKPEPASFTNHATSIEFDHVTFEIEGKEILHDISFELHSGNTIGIMGATGSGKTTLISLLQRFYDVSNGSIRLNGVDLRDLSLDDIRSRIALVMQDVFLFSDSICENVKLGQKNTLKEETIHRSLEQAMASEFVDKLEEQDHTIIGERGVGLSGGQKQRISIARALAKHAPILVMDDATSALDMETESSIQETLNHLEATTKIIVAHRISAVRYANEIIVLDHGQIVERGTHSELLKAKGKYYETYLAQYGEYLANLPEKDSSLTLQEEERSLNSCLLTQ